MEKVELPFDFDPPIRAYHHYAFPLGILKASGIDFRAWFYNNHIQLQYDRDDGCPFNFADGFFLNTDCLIKEIVHRETLKANNVNQSSFMRNAIDMGYYIYTFVDEYYIPHRNAYRKFNIMHDILAYGHDKNGFFMAGYNDKGNFGSVFVNDGQFERANKGRLILMKASPYAKHELDIGQIAGLIKDYLNSSRLSFTNVKSSNLWGLRSYSFFKEHLRSVRENTQELDMRAFQVLLEHKLCMQRRLLYINDNTDINLVPQIDSFAGVAGKAQYIKNIALVYILRQRPACIGKINTGIGELIDLETGILEQVLNILESSVHKNKS